ncbi:MAG: FtsX-like permease family protein, partial [Longimicrobiales bacterium]|nr:FtsX-like permease family protein [Longimicrobiales bacterium]
LRAFGASRMRIARQFLAESVFLALLGGAMGLVVAWLIMIPFRGQSLVRMPAFEGFTIGPEILRLGVVSALGAALLFGTVPALLASRFDLGAALRSSGARETGRLGSLRTALSASQIAMTLALVVGAVLLLRTVANLRSVETGVDVERVVRVTVDLSMELEPAELHLLQRQLLGEVSSLPGVEHAALDVYGPHGARTLGRIGLPGANVDDEEPRESLPMIWQVTPGWFELFGMETIAGRTFEDSDWRVPSADPVILTASLARRLFGRTDVVGQIVMAGARDLVERRIVGVVEDYRSLYSPSEPQDAYFVPYGDVRRSYLTLFAKTESRDGTAAEAIRNVVESSFPDVAVPDPVYLTDTVEEIHQEERMLGQFLWILSVFGLLMSAVGLYGAIYFVVVNRRREFGIRLALGADRKRILQLVARSALAITLGGAVVGLLAAYWLSRVLQNRLFGVGVLDASSYLAAVSLVVLVAVLACVAPARAALQSDPVATLRAE